MLRSRFSCLTKMHTTVCITIVGAVFLVTATQAVPIGFSVPNPFQRGSSNNYRADSGGNNRQYYGGGQTNLNSRFGDDSGSSPSGSSTGSILGTLGSSLLGNLGHTSTGHSGNSGNSYTSALEHFNNHRQPNQGHKPTTSHGWQQNGGQNNMRPSQNGNWPQGNGGQWPNTKQPLQNDGGNNYNQHQHQNGGGRPVHPGNFGNRPPIEQLDVIPVIVTLPSDDSLEFDSSELTEIDKKHSHLFFGDAPAHHHDSSAESGSQEVRKKIELMPIARKSYLYAAHPQIVDYYRADPIDELQPFYSHQMDNLPSRMIFDEPIPEIVEPIPEIIEPIPEIIEPISPIIEPIPPIIEPIPQIVEPIPEIIKPIPEIIVERIESPKARVNLVETIIPLNLESKPINILAIEEPPVLIMPEVKPEPVLTVLDEAVIKVPDIAPIVVLDTIPPPTTVLTVAFDKEKIKEKKKDEKKFKKEKEKNSSESEED